MLHYLWMFIVGIAVGAIARFVMPGAQHMGLIMTGLLGIGGAFVGGFITQLIKKPAPDTKAHPTGILMSIVGALIVLFVWTQLSH